MPCWRTSRNRASIRASASAWTRLSGTGTAARSISSSRRRLRISRSACTPLYSSMRSRISPSSSSIVSNSEAVVDLLPGRPGARSLDLQLVVVGEVDLRADLDGGREAEGVALEVGDLDVGGRHGPEGLLLGGVGVEPGQRLLEHALADGVLAHAGLEDLAGHLALAKPGHLEFLAELADGVRGQLVDLGRLHLDEEADLRGTLAFDCRFHRRAS